MIDSYIKSLNRFVKTNGDKLLPSTIESYSKVITKYEKDIINVQHDTNLLLEFFNDILTKKPNMITYSAFRMYLIHLNFDYRDKKSKIFQSLITPLLLGKGTESSVRKLQAEVISIQELKLVFNNVNLYWKMLLSIMYDTACRKDELLNLKFSSILYKDINNYKDFQDIKNGIYAEVNVIGKGFKQRTVYLTKNTVELLKKYSENKKDNEYIIRFFKSDNKLYEKQDFELWKRIVKLHKKYLSRHVHPHTYRHTKLQHMANSGVPVLQIASYAGHTDIKTTMKYIHNSTFQGKQGFIKSIVELVE